jgi:hypothetical protein
MGWRIRTFPPGTEYFHAVTAEEVDERIRRLPPELTRVVENVELAAHNRGGCLGLAWGTSIYLYPVDGYEFWHYRKPDPFDLIEQEQAGGKWDQPTHDRWRCTHTPETMKRLYLDNVLVHEIGHLNDQRNASYHKREAFAEHFAREYGIRPCPRKIKKRHHLK